MGKKDNRSVSSFDGMAAEDVAERLGTSLMQISRWAKNLDDPENYEKALAKYSAKFPQALEFQTAVHVGHNSGDNEWYTPKEYADAARVVLGAIDLDPATSDTANAVIQAGQIFTQQESGLEQRWDGRVWLNPPYAQPLVTQFAEKLAASVQAGTVTSAIVLVNNATETQWFRTIVDVAAAICFPYGRVRFWQPNSDSAAPLQGQAVIYVGQDIDRFADAFSPFGFIAVIRR